MKKYNPYTIYGRINSGEDFVAVKHFNVDSDENAIVHFAFYMKNDFWNNKLGANSHVAQEYRIANDDSGEYLLIASKIELRYETDTKNEYQFFAPDCEHYAISQISSEPGCYEKNYAYFMAQSKFNAIKIFSDIVEDAEYKYEYYVNCYSETEGEKRDMAWAEYSYALWFAPESEYKEHKRILHARLNYNLHLREELTTRWIYEKA